MSLYLREHSHGYMVMKAYEHFIWCSLFINSNFCYQRQSSCGSCFCSSASKLVHWNSFLQLRWITVQFQWHKLLLVSFMFYVFIFKKNKKLNFVTSRLYFLFSKKNPCCREYQKHIRMFRNFLVQTISQKHVADHNGLELKAWIGYKPNVCFQNFVSERAEIKWK